MVYKLQKPDRLGTSLFAPVPPAGGSVLSASVYQEGVGSSVEQSAQIKNDTCIDFCRVLCGGREATFSPGVKGIETLISYAIIDLMKAVIAGDHYTVDLMEKVHKQLLRMGISVENIGSKDKSIEVTLQEIIPAVTNLVVGSKADFGILACGTGVGVEIGANRFKGIRASLCRDDAQAKNARVYDDANVLCLGSWYEDDVENILAAWVNNQFDGDHSRSKMLKDFDELG